MKRYLLFGGDTYYACGGWEDFVGEYTSIGAAKEDACVEEYDNNKYDWWHIVDVDSNRIVEKHGFVQC